MLMKLDETDEAILRIMQDDVPLVSRPFLEVAEKLGIREGEVIERVQKMVDSGVVRRFSASIRHRKLGIKANPLIAWKVPRERVEEVGNKLASYEEVTHCYERPFVPGKWEYNLYTMVHGYDKESVEKLVEKLSRAVGIKDYLMLYSSREYKKTYKRYE
jgi:DNA-binding Lrp family transcriptional regulator